MRHDNSDMTGSHHCPSYNNSVHSDDRCSGMDSDVVDDSRRRSHNLPSCRRLHLLPLKSQHAVITDCFGNMTTVGMVGTIVAYGRTIHTKFVTRTKHLSIDRIEGAGGHWW